MQFYRNHSVNHMFCFFFFFISGITTKIFFLLFFFTTAKTLNLLTFAFLTLPKFITSGFTPSFVFFFSFLQKTFSQISCCNIGLIYRHQVWHLNMSWIQNSSLFYPHRLRSKWNSQKKSPCKFRRHLNPAKKPIFAERL